MPMKKLIVLLGLSCMTLVVRAQGNNYAQNYKKFPGLALTPPMGWNSWNKFACNVDEEMIRQMADAMVSSGMKHAGYTYINIDDCWHGERDSLGFIHADPRRFPSGIKALADYVHSKGLKLGIYSDAGSQTCGGRPGSRGYEFQDALTYASWGIDYLKYDWCNTEGLKAEGAYKTITAALRKAGRPMVLSICEWGTDEPWVWGKEVGHLWRTTGDIFNCFDCIKDHGTWKAWGVMQILDKQEGLRKYAGPGHWNDPDMLEIGNGSLSPAEDRAHFSMWAMLAAPLIAGNDIRTMTAETREVLTNKAVIAVNQDSLGVQGFRHAVKDSIETWYKPLKNGEWAICFLNRSTRPATLEHNWKAVVKDAVFEHELNTNDHIYRLKNLWTGKEQGTTKDGLQVNLPPHDVLLLRAFPPAGLAGRWETVHSQASALPADKNATRETINLYRNLKNLSSKGYLVGHQDALAYGVNWKYVNGRSDVKELTGDYPSLYGWELGDLELGAAVNLDSVPFDKMKTYIREGYSRGGVITISWHGNNPMTGKNAWDAAPGTVGAILPGGAKHAVFVQQLDRVAAFLGSLTAADGRYIPILFRPFHELTGSWFWWGAKSCTAEEFKTLFRFTVDYLRVTKGLHHLLICYNTGTEFNDKDGFLERYPGDDYADILSFDTYQHNNSTSFDAAFVQSLYTHMSIVDKIAIEKNKIAAIGEMGFNNIPYDKWFTLAVAESLKGTHPAYLLFWRNAGFKPKDNATEYYVPYKGHKAATDFKDFYRLPETLFEKEAARLKLYE